MPDTLTKDEWIESVGGDSPSGEFQTIVEHFMTLVRGMNPTYFEVEGLEKNPPEYILKDPLDTDLARLIGRGFPIAPQMPEGDVIVRRTVVNGRNSEWVSAEGALPDRVMLYLHGGGYVMGDIDNYRCFIARLSRASKCSVLAIDYRLAPEHPFPAGLEDALAAYKTLIEDTATGSGQNRKFYIVGDSAGGGLALATTLKAMRERLRVPDAVIAMSPATDLTQSGSTLTPAEVIGGGKQFSLYYGNTDPTHPLVSPLYADLEGFPPVLLQAGEIEGYLDDSVRFAKKAHEAGVDVRLQIWRNMPHVHQVMAPHLPEANAAIQAMGEFLLDG